MNQHLQEPVEKQTIDYEPHPTCNKFHRSNAYVRGLMGPVGSGKSVACCFEIFRQACLQPPGLAKDRQTGLPLRTSRWCAVRATYPELAKTTVQTWLNWFPETRSGKFDDGVTKMNWGSPITAKVRYYLEPTPAFPKGTMVNLEIWFLALDVPADKYKLKSHDFTAAWVNEAREIDWELVVKVPERTGRFPNNAQQGHWLRKGMIMDTNPPDDTSGWYKTFEEECPSNWEMFRQPGALIPVLSKDGKTYTYDRNPLCENVMFQRAAHDEESTGYEYWEDLIGMERYTKTGFREGRAQKGWTPEKIGQQISTFYSETHENINVEVCGNYGTYFDGKAVFKGTWDDLTHFSKTPLDILKGVPIRLGFDFGYTHPACLICQLSPRGQLRVLREILPTDTGLRQLLKEHVDPVRLNEFPTNECINWGDPAGLQHSQHDGMSCFQEAQQCGYTIYPAPGNNNLALRLGAVSDFLLRRIGSEPGLIVDPSCIQLRKAFNGGYHFKRVQVGGKAVFREIPDKNWASHPMDCLENVCLSLTEPPKGYRKNGTTTPQKKFSALAY